MSESRPEAWKVTPLDTSWLRLEEAAFLFGDSSHHVPVGLMRIENPKIIYLNHAAIVRDPNFAACDFDTTRYEKHLLSACAYLVADPDTQYERGRNYDAVGYADRYGGTGIGSNGGSGRAIIVNGYHVKGVGRTQLVSSLTDAAHASGGAYLEETVREVIYGEIVRAEFPHSAIPTLALVDTGLIQVWDEPAGPKVERRTLLVRPCFVRPAHFHRASNFVSHNIKEGQEDTARVAVFFERMSSLLGVDALGNRYREFWVAWAAQMAYSFVHRMPHGSNTVSNICCDGKLLDFGATSAVPSWANVATMLTPQPFVAQFAGVLRALRATAYYFGRYLEPQLATEAGITGVAKASFEVYRRVIIVETMRICGMPRALAESVASGADREMLWAAILQVIFHFQRERIDMAKVSRPGHIDWDLPSIWDCTPPNHLRDLASFVRNAVPSSEHELARQRCRILADTRIGLYREDLKKSIFSAVDSSQDGVPPDRVLIQAFIERRIVENRRDVGCEIAGAAPLGFAIGDSIPYLLFRDSSSEALFAIKETAPCDRVLVGETERERFGVKRFSADSIEFVAGLPAPARTSVKIWQL